MFKRFLVVFLLLFMVVPFGVCAESSVSDDVSKKMLINLQKANKNFEVYRDLNEVNYNSLKYFFYEKDGKYNLLLTNATSLVKVRDNEISVMSYSPKIMDLEKKSTQNFYVFDKDGKLLDSSFKNNSFELLEPKGNFIFSNYVEGVPSWSALESLDGMISDDGDSSIPGVILKVFNKVWEWISDVGKTIKEFFVPENAIGVVSDFFGGIVDKITLQFKTIFDYVNGIVDIFKPKTPKMGLMASTPSSSSSDFDPAVPGSLAKDFYFIKFELDNPVSKGQKIVIEPFIGLLPLSWEIYLLCNFSLVTFTMLALYRKVVGDGGVFDK
ncbi:hypothetical protein P4K71_26450 [Bacillus cereus]|uniref:hypothetical protein n=1 Tax=Bacillus cereus TaxID=1396 RepID=UPI002DBC2AF0|nr:hypothetical protein [Bacillus cereus]MEB8909564.1 hypothetical protein [Bacillus cereus]MEB9926285.1 hypothetical protein [Bacillus cereus]MEB9986884.1 hypothetical protein [Bacillus cereus]MEB9992064.1 hypothetical protein [Bacillus cereus]